jgi:hypothetical protein
MKTVSDAVLAIGTLVKAVAEGDLTPTEARTDEDGASVRQNYRNRRI